MDFILFYKSLSVRYPAIYPKNCSFNTFVQMICGQKISNPVESNILESLKRNLSEPSLRTLQFKCKNYFIVINKYPAPSCPLESYPDLCFFKSYYGIIARTFILHFSLVQSHKILQFGYHLTDYARILGFHSEFKNTLVLLGLPLLIRKYTSDHPIYVAWNSYFTKDPIP